MNTLSLSQTSRISLSKPRRSRPITRLPLHCETLESRQLLSVGQGALTAAALPNFTVPMTAPVVFALPASSYLNITIEFGSFAGLNQFQINLSSASNLSSSFGGSQFFGPAPTFGAAASGISSNPVSSPIGTTVGAASTGASTGNLLTPLGTTLTPNLAITPLNPAATSFTTAETSTPAYVVPPPLQAPAMHLTASSAPVTNINSSTAISAVDEQPTSITHFGQGPHYERRPLLLEADRNPEETPSVIDFVEPRRAGVVPGAGVQPVAPADGANPAAPTGGKAEPGKPADGERAPDGKRPMAPPQPTDDDLSGLSTLIHGGATASSNDTSESAATMHTAEPYYSWSLSTVFGATVVAVGGYHLVIRDRDRQQGRWIPRWVGAERPTKSKPEDQVR